MAEKIDAFPLLDYLDGLVDELRGLAAQAVTELDVDAVHDARVATRRLKAAIDLLHPILSKRHRKPFEKITRQLRRRLGPLRDADVMLEHLAKIKSSRHAPAARWMSEQLAKLRQEAMGKAGQLAPSRVLAELGAWWGIREEIVQAKEAANCLLAETVHVQVEAFAQAAARLVAGAGHTDPHQLRIASKSLRYTLEMAKKHGVPLGKPIMSAFKQIQTALGNWHDYVVLNECILQESTRQHTAYHDGELQEALLLLAVLAMRRCHGPIAKVTEFWKSHGQQLVDEVTREFPLTTAAPADQAAEDNPPPAGEPVNLRFEI